MSRHRHTSSSYNMVPQAPLPPIPAPTPAPTLTSLTSSLNSMLSALVPKKSASPMTFSMPAIPVGELFGGVSNTVRGLVLNDNWWVVLLIIFLFFPNISSKMFGGLLKE